jgi:hypothetical protein
VQFADHPVADQLGRLVKMSGGPELAIHPEHPLLLRHQPGQHPAFLNVARDRFLERHILARAHRGQGHRHVPVVGRGDHHRIDVRPRQQLAEVAVARAALRPVVRIGRLHALGQAPGIDVADGQHAAVVGLQERSQVGVIGLAPQADQPDADLLAGRVGAEQPAGQDQWTCSRQPGGLEKASSVHGVASGPDRSGRGPPRPSVMTDPAPSPTFAADC